MKRSDRYVGAMQAPPEERPEVLDSICVDAAFDVSLRVVNHCMNVVGIQSVLHSTAGNRAAAADTLGIHRATLRKKLTGNNEEV
jgi:DNA-binding protein Fis